MSESAEDVLSRLLGNRRAVADLNAAIDRDIAELVDTHHRSLRRLATDLGLRSDNSVRLAVRRHRARTQVSDTTRGGRTAANRRASARR
ncbi:hypothetical protein [Catellatospora sp. NPDC049133]|uniref:hypothetical protein n=1 Tax=Catellatospora sp. NPDC049133 TaxID=3155499 RepID=UPI0033F65FF4